MSEEKKVYGCKSLWRVSNEIQIAIDTEGYVYVRQKNARYSTYNRESWNAWQRISMDMSHWKKEDPSKCRVGDEYAAQSGACPVDAGFLQSLGMNIA